MLAALRREECSHQVAPPPTCAEYRMNTCVLIRARAKKLWKESPELHRQLRFPSALRAPPIDAFQKHRQLRSRQRNRAASCLRPHKAPALQPLREQAQPVAIEPKNFDQIATPAAEHKHL